MNTTLINCSLASSGRHGYAHADVYIRRQTSTLVRKSGRQFFGMDTREIKTSLQDDAEDGHNLEKCEIQILVRR